MTNNSNYFEEMEVWVIRRKENYQVILEDDIKFNVNGKLVEKISSTNDQTEELIAILLAYVEYARSNINSAGKKREKPISDDILSTSITELLHCYSIDTLINLFKVLKWHEISLILNAESPVIEIEKIV